MRRHVWTWVLVWVALGACESVEPAAEDISAEDASVATVDDTVEPTPTADVTVGPDSEPDGIATPEEDSEEVEADSVLGSDTSDTTDCGPDCSPTTCVEVGCEAEEDGDLCNGTMVCDVSGAVPVCVIDPLTVVTCPGTGLPCLVAQCEPTTGLCEEGPVDDGTPCADDDLCNGDELCTNGNCEPGEPLACDDDDPCTGEETCESAIGCVAGEPPGSLGDEICDGLDNDCDGQTDEGLVYTGPDGTSIIGPGIPCGRGVCVGGVTYCDAEGTLICSSDTAIGLDNDCDQVDDDCDGQLDEAFASEVVTTCGIGACAAEGSMVCIDGETVSDCAPADDNAVAEVCNDVDDDCDEVVDETLPLEICNGVDDDCDGDIDEAEAIIVPEVCNGADDDCDGTIDEGMPDLDEDSIPDCIDEDADGDTIDNAIDNCPEDPNTDQNDEDNDGLGDICDPVNANEACGGFAITDVIVVTTTDDELQTDGDCSLREALMAANNDLPIDACGAGNGDDIISLGIEGGTYTLGIPGADEDQNFAGDLDLQGSVSIYGCGHTATVLSAGQLDRALHIHAGVTVQLVGLTIRDGRVEGTAGAIPAGGQGAGFGGAIYNAGNLTMQDCIITNNQALGGRGSDGEHAPGNGGGGGGGAALGGAIYNAGTLTIDPGDGTCHFENNTVTGGPGGNGMWHAGTTPYTGYGGGGGGDNGGLGGYIADGEAGGFGGGGGGGGGKTCGEDCGTTGGDGGFGGGGGGGGGSSTGGLGGPGGGAAFGGGQGGQGAESGAAGGAGGAGLGGAIFNHDGTVSIGPCAFVANHAEGGAGGQNYFDGGTTPQGGGGYGGALFDLGTAAVLNTETTFQDNTATTEGQSMHQVDGPL